MPEEVVDSTSTEQQKVAETAKSSWEELFKDQDPAEVHKALSHARTWEQRAKDNVEKAKKYDELEEANKTEAQKAADEIERLKHENESLKVTTLRSEVAVSKGVPPQLLSGSTKEELEAAADALLAFKGVTPTTASADGQGDVGEQIGGDGELSVDEILKAATGR